jgi:hypothetical protein
MVCKVNLSSSECTTMINVILLRQTLRCTDNRLTVNSRYVIYNKMQEHYSLHVSILCEMFVI